MLGALVGAVLVAGPACPTVAAQTDDDLVRAAVEQFEQTWNGRDFEAWSNLLCKDIRGKDEFNEIAFGDMRAITGRLLLDVTSLDIQGDQATAIVEQHGEDADDITFAREDGDWKWCEP